jgi:hypothetical protein
MQGGSLTLGKALSSSSSYRIPPYQRAYQWDVDRWQGLAHDSFQLALKPPSDPPHWLGILLLSDETGVKVPGDKRAQLYTVIDGQQRLTTTILWLAALAHHAKEHNKPISLDVAKLAALQVQEIDRIPFKVAVEGGWRLAKNAKHLHSQPLRAYTYFRWLLHLGEDALAEEEPIKMPTLKPQKEAGDFEVQWDRHLATKTGSGKPRGKPVDCAVLCDDTRHETTVFALIHEPAHDESQATIFDTLNGMRTELQPLDHVRNSLFVRLQPSRAKTLYEKEWQPAEHRLRQVRLAGVTVERAFLYDFLIAQGEKARQKSINAMRGSSHFNVMTRGFTERQLSDFVETDVIPAMATWPAVVRTSDEINIGGSIVKPPKAALQRMTTIRNLSSNPANPVVLHFLTLWACGSITAAELNKALGYLEAYLARLVLAGRPLSPLRARIMDVMGKLDREVDPEVLRTILMAANYPKDPEIRREAPLRPMYTELGAGGCLAILRGIEAQASGTGAMFFTLGRGPGDYTIEHVFPQKPDKWLPDLAKWKTTLYRMHHVQHSIGNLAPVTVGHNSAVGNKTFAEKKKYPTAPGKAAPLKVNAKWRNANQWTEKQISARGKELVELAISRWSL